MKIYCSSCDKVQPAIIDNCRDAKTNEPYQDIVCGDCHLVIASGKDIRRPWVGLTDEEIQTLWRGSEHMTVNQVCRAIEAKLKERNT